MDSFQLLMGVGVVARASGAPGEFAKAIASHCGSEASAGRQLGPLDIQTLLPPMQVQRLHGLTLGRSARDPSARVPPYDLHPFLNGTAAVLASSARLCAGRSAGTRYCAVTVARQ